MEEAVEVMLPRVATWCLTGSIEYRQVIEIWDDSAQSLQKSRHHVGEKESARSDPEQLKSKRFGRFRH